MSQQQRSDQTYEGYANWDTFAVFAWLSNVETTDRDARYHAQANNPEDALRQYVERLRTMGANTRGEILPEPRTQGHPSSRIRARRHVGSGLNSEGIDWTAVDWADLVDSFTQD